MSPVISEYPSAAAAIVNNCLGAGFSGSATDPFIGTLRGRVALDLHALSVAARVNRRLWTGFSINVAAPFIGTLRGRVALEHAGVGNVAQESIRCPCIGGVVLGGCFLDLGGSALLGAGFIGALPSSFLFFLEHSSGMSLSPEMPSPSSFVLDEKCGCGEVASIVVHCSLRDVTLLLPLGSVAPAGLLALGDLAGRKSLGPSIMACRFSIGVVTKCIY